MTESVAIRKPLRRLPRDDEGHSRYLHPGGYVITQAHREWNHDRVPGGYVGSNDPKWWWEVYKHASGSADLGAFHPWAHSSYGVETFDTLREARAWCDANPREGWGVAHG